MEHHLPITDSMIEMLTADEFREVISAIVCYLQYDVQPDFNGNRVLDMFWACIKSQIDSRRVG